ncbi:hypothetical protein [Streptomyces sp. G-G2]|uniref:hypothetical protein n=1 Tax=Streptomyces sp. G-G2 TaxID=3046201 RepID=UPI0024BAB05D|nr:hypothetical protein [Streptomyces sp. G-G2]MDJ0379889.1 hypothetical protein [Streptomyces sp. G-G2]
MTTDPAPVATLPAVAPELLAEAVGRLTDRLRRKLDAAVEACAAGTPAAEPGADGAVTFRFGADALVTLRPGPTGALTSADQATCGCLLAPGCLHRTTALSVCPLAEPTAAVPAPDPGAPSGPSPRSAGALPEPEGVAEGAEDGGGALTGGQVAAAAALWEAAAGALAAGVPAGGAVVQAELLRAAHTARLAGLPGAEAAALRVVRGLRAARDRSAAQRLTELTGAFRELLYAAARPVADGSRRAYRSGGSLRVHGLCREPVLSAAGYAGVVTHLVGSDGVPYSLADVRPGALARARGAGSGSVALGGAVLDHAGLARGGLLVVGATVSEDGRLGAGRGVRATPLRGIDWAEDPAASAFFARPAAEAVAGVLSGQPTAGVNGSDAGQSSGAGTGAGLLGCDVVVVGPSGGHLLVRELSADGSPRPDGPLVRLLPAHPHPELPHTDNLRRLAERPGLALRVLGRPDLDRAATLRPLAVGPVPGAAYTLRLPPEWLGRADLGYDRLQGAHFPAETAETAGIVGRAGSAGATDPASDVTAESPLWRVRRLLESGVAGGRRAVAEAARGEHAPNSGRGPLRRAGFTAAAELTAALAAEADRRPRDVFGRLVDPGADRYAWAWLAAATHLHAAQRSLVAASWSDRQTV